MWTLQLEMVAIAKARMHAALPHTRHLRMAHRTFIHRQQQWGFLPPVLAADSRCAFEGHVL